MRFRRSAVGILTVAELHVGELLSHLRVVVGDQLSRVESTEPILQLFSSLRSSPSPFAGSIDSRQASSTRCWAECGGSVDITPV